MRVFRSRAGVVASSVLTWQILALMFVPTAACCRLAPALAAGSEMANCPMSHSTQEQQQQEQQVCPRHAQASASHDCQCPKLSCSPHNNGFLALFGPIGVLPAPVAVAANGWVGQAPLLLSLRTSSLAHVPNAPPPRI
jgi:hypothetical protein